MTEKAKTIFDHLAGLTYKKTSWDELSDVDKKSFNNFMINRWLSMNMDFIEIVNEFQKYTIGQLSPKLTYRLYFDVLPKQKQFNKYIKGKKDEKYNPDLVKLISNHYEISRNDATDILDLFHLDRLDSLIKIIKKYGKSDKEIKQLLK